MQNAFILSVRHLNFTCFYKYICKDNANRAQHKKKVKKLSFLGLCMGKATLSALRQMPKTPRTAHRHSAHVEKSALHSAQTNKKCVFLHKISCDSAIETSFIALALALSLQTKNKNELCNWTVTPDLCLRAAACAECSPAGCSMLS